MDAFKVKLQPHINTEININFGCIGTNYTEILIVQDGKIKSIGNFIYRLWSELSGKENVDKLLAELAVECEKYRTGMRGRKPSLCFWEKELRVI
jgi:hypothetical protein